MVKNEELIIRTYHLLVPKNDQIYSILLITDENKSRCISLIGFGFGAPAHVIFAMSAEQTRECVNPEQQWHVGFTLDGVISAPTRKNKKGRIPKKKCRRLCISCLFRDVVAIVFSIWVPRALQCVHKKGLWTRHWNYMAHGPRKIPDTRNKSSLWNTKDTRVTAAAPHFSLGP